MHYVAHILLGEFSVVKTDEWHSVKEMKYEGRNLELDIFGGCSMYATADQSGLSVGLCILFDVSITRMVRSNPSQVWMHIGLYSICVLSLVGRGFAID
jgi:hypothetical protein